MGRLLRERGRDGGDRRQRRRVPRGDGTVEGYTESAGCWQEFLLWLKLGGLRGVRVFTGDKVAGTVSPIAEVFSAAVCQGRTVCFLGNVLTEAPKTRCSQFVAMLKALHTMGLREATGQKALAVARTSERLTVNIDCVVSVLDVSGNSLVELLAPLYCLIVDNSICLPLH